MYKLMLVDDEDEVRYGIEKSVDFEACGFVLCAQATGAIDALDKAARFLPDVVFTDVHMPYMDGMEMISRLQEMYPTMKYIVLSGYDDFKYVKQALQRQVIDYLLKPLSAQGIMKVLRAVKQQLDQETRERMNLELLQKKADANAQQVRKSAFLEFLSSDHVDAQALCSYALQSEVQVQFPMHLALVALYRTPENLEVLRHDFDSQPHLLGLSVSGVLGEVVRRRGVGEMMDYRQQFLLILPVPYEQALSICNDAVETLRHYLGLEVSVGLSVQVTGYAGLYEAYQGALTALDLRLLSPRGGVYAARSLHAAQEGDLLGAQVLARLGTLCRSGQAQQIADFYAELSQAIVQQCISQKKRQLFLTRLLATLLAAAENAGVDVDADNACFKPENVLLPAQLAVAMQEMCQLTQWVADAVRRDAANSGGDDVIAAVIAYTRENFADKELSLEGLCATYKMSQTQFSLLFKRETGTSFLQFLLDLRIQAAQKLLLQSAHKIYQIAEETGFGDASYFSYCFKQRCGLSPKEYRVQGGVE